MKSFPVAVLRTGSRAALSLVLFAAAPAVRAQSTTSFSLTELPLWEAEEELRLGGDHGTGAPFRQVVAVRVGPRGEIYVLDAQDRQVRVHSEDGRLMRLIGGLGLGPGEFQYPDGLGLLGDTVWVTDTGNGRISLFTANGRHLQDVDLNGPTVFTNAGAIILLQPKRLRPDGTFESVPNVVKQMGGTPPTATDSVRVPRIRFSASGQVLDTLGFRTLYLAPDTRPTLPVLIGWRTLELPNPFTDQPLRDEFGGTLYTIERPTPSHGGEAVFRITWTPLATDATEVTRYYRYLPIRMDPEAANAIMAQLTDRVPNYGVPREEVERSIRGAIEVPGFQVPVGGVLHALDGGLWLLREVGAYGLTLWTMLDPEGRPSGDVVLPPDFTPHAISDGRVWGIHRTPQNVQSVVRYKLVPVQAGGG